jgi:hypothetical protein
MVEDVSWKERRWASKGGLLERQISEGKVVVNKAQDITKGGSERSESWMMKSCSQMER